MNAKLGTGTITWSIGFWVILLSFMAAGCSSTQDKSNKAQAEYTKEKTKTLQQYKDCAKKAKGDEAELQKCDALLKAIEAVEGTSTKPATGPHR